MKIVRFEVYGLNGRSDDVVLLFNEDLNIFTGRNGSGKTSALKLLWFMLSGNALLALVEVEFKKVVLETSEYKVTLIRLSKNTCKIIWEKDGVIVTLEDERDSDGDVVYNAEDYYNSKVRLLGNSVYFPTFRRIEGGYSIQVGDNQSGGLFGNQSNIDESLKALSRKMSQGNHSFVASLSTLDVISLILKNYTVLSERFNKLQQQQSRDVIRKIKEFESGRYIEESEQLSSANELLDEIRSQIENIDSRKDQIMKPFDEVKKLVLSLFNHSGIKLERISLGDAAGAVNSDKLSAGEKQMLSFIVYNAFYQDSIIIIDEPELSLHVDWQRRLFPILQKQQSSNQFIIATHSPFIYGKYPDKELKLDSLRGDEGV